MQLAEHELHDLEELTLSCVNTITNMALFMNQANDPELKSILETHFPYNIKDYNTKVEYLRSTGVNKRLPVPSFSDTLQNHVSSGVPLQPVTPRVSVQALNDREIATAYLLTLKRAGREYAWSAMEASNPDLRCFFEDAFRMASHNAYDIWQWMVKKGYYALEEAPMQTIQAIGNMFNPVQQQQQQQQQPAPTQAFFS
jgi:spore coat protein CotF